MLCLRPGFAEPVAEILSQSAQIWAEAGQFRKHLRGGQVADAGTGAIPLRVRAGHADVRQRGVGHASYSNDGFVRHRRDTRTPILDTPHGAVAPALGGWVVQTAASLQKPTHVGLATSPCMRTRPRSFSSGDRAFVDGLVS
jgi:hypothetical protein